MHRRSAAAETTSLLNGAALSAAWIVPFLGILLSIALVPLTAPNFWNHHFGKTSAFWSLAFLVPFAANYGINLTLQEVFYTLLAEYLPFIILLLALYTVAGGINIRGNLHGTPALNTGLLGLGTVLASIMGTTGAAMLLIRPLLRANDNRKHRAHVVIFFIFLVANIGGALTPLGDPPLFLGFLKGVDFFWATKAMFWPMLTAAGILLALFYAIDAFLYKRADEERPKRMDPTPDAPIRIDGKVNFVLLGAILGCVLWSGLWRPGLELHALWHATRVAECHARYGAARHCVGIVAPYPRRRAQGAPLRVGTDHRGREALRRNFPDDHPGNRDSARGSMRARWHRCWRWSPTTRAAPMMRSISGSSGALSSFLDNAPTYLVFFNLAGGDPASLMGSLATTLTAISAGAVFMGANTYIGNAPNFMVKSIAQSRGVRMPGFFGYMAWSSLILLPLFGLLTLLFFH